MLYGAECNKGDTMYTKYVVLVPLLLQIIGLAFVVILDPYIQKQHKRIMLINTFLVFSLLVQNVSEYILSKYFGMSYIRTIVAAYGYCIRPLIILLLIYIVGENLRLLPLWIMIGFNAAVYLSSLFTDKIGFFISEDNDFERGLLGFTCYYISAALFVFLIYLTFREVRESKKRESLIPVFNIIIIVGSVAFEVFFDRQLRLVSYLTMAVVSSTLLYYIWLHLRFVREHEQALMAEQRIQIMMSQIQPHFLYNTLSTIQALCRIDPEKAFVITEHFGSYLRQNLDSLSQPNLIPVTKELENTKIYGEIEQVRFDNISVEYDTPEKNFMIPALTIQPLVENAIRHGIRSREHGIVRVSTSKTSNGFDIVVEDNGKGFDIEMAEQADNTHIGLRNIRERIQSMCGGTMQIESKLNIGTKITIHIPDRKEKLHRA